MRNLILITLISITTISQLFATEVDPPVVISTDLKVKEFYQFTGGEVYIQTFNFDKYNGSIDVRFSSEAKPNIYYKIVQKEGSEVMKGSFHNLNEQQISIHGATDKLPEGEYLIYFETEDQFFIAISFKRKAIKA